MVLRLVYLAGCAWFGLVGLAAAAFRCDESCFNNGGDWRHDNGAWQWSAAGWLGGALVALAVLVVALAGRRASLAQAALAVQVVAGAALVVLLEGRWGSNGAVFALALALFCGFALTRRDLVARLGGDGPDSIDA
jgi:hypothetical protein